MKRPMCVIGITYSIAMWAAFFLSGMQSLQISVALSLTGALLMLFPRKKLRIFIVMLLTAAMAMGVYSLHYRRQIHPFTDMERERINVEGMVEVVGSTRNAARYTVLARFPERPELPQATIILNQYGGGDFTEGDFIRCEAVLSFSQEMLFQRQHYSRGIVATGYIRGTPEEVLDANFPLQSGILRLRARLSENVYHNLPIDTAPLVNGMVMGDTGRIETADYIALQRSGTAHLLAVSGLHLSVFSGFVLRMLGHFRLSERLRSLLVIGSALAFTVAVGFSPSVVRAFVMVTVMMTGNVIRRKSDPLNSLGFALLLIGLVSPWWLLRTGLWMSAAATAGILIIGIPISEKITSQFCPKNRFEKSVIGMFADGFGITAGAYLFTLPILLFTNGWLSLFSPFANLLISPFTGFVVVGGIITAIIPPAFSPIAAVAVVVRFCTGMVMGISSFFSDLPFCIITFDHIWKLVALFCFAAILGFFLWKKRSSVVICIAVSIMALILSVSGLLFDIAAKSMVELVCVGHVAHPMLIRGKHAVLLGVPDRYAASSVIHYLIYRGIDEIDLLVAPDFDGKISSSLVNLGNSFSVGCALGPEDPFLRGQLARGLPGVEVYPSDGSHVLTLGNVEIKFPAATGDIVMRVGNRSILQSERGYDIIDKSDEETILLLNGEVVLPPGVSPRLEPLGSFVFSEIRIPLQID